MSTATGSWRNRAATALLVYAVAISLVGAAARFQVADLDMYHEMALFRVALEQGSIPRDDVFAYTPTVSPSVHHEWATGAVLYGIVVAAGLGGTGLLLLRYLLLVGTAAACIAVARRRGASWATIVITAPFATSLFLPGFATLRAHQFTFFFLACLLLLLERDREGNTRWVAAWAVMFVLWLNLHGGFLVGLGLLGVYVVESAWRRRRTEGRWAVPRHHLLALFLPVPLLLVNPYGFAYIPYLWHAITLDRPLIAEWAPMWDRSVLPILWAFLLLSVGVVVYGLVKTRRVTFAQFPLVLVAGAAALSAQRLLPVYAVVWFAYVPALLSGTPLEAVAERGWKDRRAAVLVLLLVVSALGTYRGLTNRAWEVRVPTTAADTPTNFYPAGAVSYLRENQFRGNVMTPFDVGAYVSWHLHPHVLVGMDSRYEVAYPSEAVMENYLLYGAAGDWNRALEESGTDLALVPTGGRLDQAMSAAEGVKASWMEVYRDDGYSLFASRRVAPTLPREDRSGVEILASFP